MGFLASLCLLFPSVVVGCTLNCENGGHCEQLPIIDLARAVRSGQMIERCICPIGFIGTGCEVPLNISFFAGVDECSVMDLISAFAGRMCRHPYTDYCSGQYKEDLPYCTNGGKCRGDLISASVSPGDTSVNELYENTGCLCPSDYYGPHCEFVHSTSNIESRLKARNKAEGASPQPVVTQEGDQLGQSGLIGGLSREQLKNLFYSKDDTQDTSSRQLHLLWIPFGLLIASVLTVLTFARHRRQRRHEQLLQIMVDKVGLQESSTTEYSASDHLAPFVIPEDMSISENQVLSSATTNSLPYSFSESDGGNTWRSSLGSDLLKKYFV